MDKVAMNLVWHSCKNYPPEEKFNECLYITDGKCLTEVEWDNGYWVDHDGREIRNLDGLWWADILQTIGKFEPIQ